MNRYLIVNADDFGLSAGVNRGIVECAEHGVLTSASLMVRWPAAVEAGAYAQKNRAISIGLHVDLGEWVLRNGEWGLLYKVVDAADAKAVEREIHHQVAEFRRLVGRDPSHLDSHQHVHRHEPARAIMRKLAREFGVSLRECDPRVRYCGDFYGQGAEGESLPELLTMANLEKILASLPDGATELGCHPGYGDDLKSPYRRERAVEARVLCQPETRALIGRFGFQLCHFGDLARITLSA
jgi:chitin disaccharide deacetylase